MAVNDFFKRELRENRTAGKALDSSETAHL